MNKLVVFLGFIAFTSTLASPLEEHPTRTLPALEHEEIHDKFGQFALRYMTADGTIVNQRGRLVPNLEGTDYVMVVEGDVSYIGDDKNRYVTKYTAGKDGYHAEGKHLPVAPEVRSK